MGALLKLEENIIGSGYSEGFFPKYTDGIKTQGGTSMVASRGLGNSAFPLGIFNLPEIVVLTSNID